MRGTRLLAAVVVITLLPLDVWASLPTDPVTKDTVIDSTQSLTGESLSPEGNIIVVRGGDLSLTNCSLGMTDGKCIEVYEGGSLTLVGTDIFCKDAGGSLGFGCWGKLVIDSCRFWHLGFYYWYPYTTGGLTLLSSNCTVLNSTFNCTYGGGITILAGAPVIRGNTFSISASLTSQYQYPEIMISQSRPVVENNILDGNYQVNKDGGDVGIETGYPAAPIIANNSFYNFSSGIKFYNVLQHMDNGSVPNTNETVLVNNTFANCSSGLMASDSYSGHGQGRSQGELPREISPEHVLSVRGSTFDSDQSGITIYGKCPTVVEGCDFKGTGNGAGMQFATGVVIDNCTFQNGSTGIMATSSGFDIINDKFDNVNTSVSSSWSGASTIADSTINNSASMGVYISGEATLLNDTISGCPFGVYRASRGNGPGIQGRDSSQGPTPEPGQVLIEQCLFAGDERGVYTEGMTNITSNVFEGNRRAVEVSSFVHPDDLSGDGSYLYNGVVDGLTIQNNLFGNNTEGIMLLATNQNIHNDGGSRIVQHNDFVNNSIGIDLLQSDADAVSNNFTRNSGWAIRTIDSESDLGSNDFGNCSRVWNELPLSVSVEEPPEGIWQAPLSYYVRSENATVDIFDRNGATLFHSDRTVYGDPKPDFSPDGFPFYFINVTSTRELGDGSVNSSGPVIVEAGKAGFGYARETLDTDGPDSITLYLSPTPDIAVTNLGFSNVTPREGEVVEGSFSIEKNDTYDPSHVSLKDVPVEIDRDGAIYWIFTIPYLQSGRAESRNLTWTAVAGLHEWTVRADPFGEFRETSEKNNARSITLDVNGRPHAVLSAPRLEALPGENVLFSGAGSSDDHGVTGYFFDFGDHNVSGWVETPRVNHSYARSGAYDVRLKVRDDPGFESDWSPALAVSILDVPPTVSISSERTVVLTLEQVNLTALAPVAEGTVLTVSWTFGDGGSMAGTGLFAVSHAYLKMGTYNVSVKVDDGEGGTAGACLCITVSDRPPVASFLVSPPEGTVLTVFTFIPTASDGDGSIISFSWDLGSGNSSTLERPVFSYFAPGIYNVSLEVTDDDGSVSAPTVRTVTVVSSPPVARSRLVGAPVRAGKEVTFDASASFDPEDRTPDFTWDFGDGATASGVVVRHTFTRPGTYTVKVTVSDRYGAETATTLNVTVPAANEKAGSDALWTGTAWVAGVLVAAGVLIVLWTGKAFMDNRGRRGPRRRKGREVTKASGGKDVYAGKLARSRQRDRSDGGSRGDRRSLYDRMQPARNGKR